MSHPDWCGRPCSDCNSICVLDQSIPCSPDCDGLNSETGEPDGAACKSCDAIKKDNMGELDNLMKKFSYDSEMSWFGTPQLRKEILCQIVSVLKTQQAEIDELKKIFISGQNTGKITVVGDEPCIECKGWITDKCDESGRTGYCYELDTYAKWNYSCPDFDLREKKG